jgi:hypothetical protein
MPRNIGLRLHDLGESIPEVEWAFHSLPESEFRACLQYEVFRERTFCYWDALRGEAAVLQNAVDGINIHILPDLVELQDELNNVRKNCVPWLSLSAEEKNELLKKSEGHSADSMSEAVWAAANLTPLQKWRLKYSGSRMALEVIVDWSRNSGEIVESFAKLVHSLRTGSIPSITVPLPTENRGNKTTPPQGLFYLAFWGSVKRDSVQFVSLAF